MEDSFYLTTLSSKGQLTLPKALRENLNLEEGQRLIVEEAPGGFFVKKASVREASEDLEESEWAELERLAEETGKIYKTGQAFLKSLKVKVKPKATSKIK